MDKYVFNVVKDLYSMLVGYVKLLILFVRLLIHIMEIVQPAILDILLTRIEFVKNLMSQIVILYVLNGIKMFVQDALKVPILGKMECVLFLIHHAKL